MNSAGDPAMAERPRAILWVVVSFAASVICATIVLVLLGSGTQGTVEALRATARLSFLLFWPAYAGGLFRRFGFAPFGWLTARRREFGLGFASAHLVHVGLIVWFFHIATHQTLSTKTVLFDGIGIGWVYLLAVLSLANLRRSLAPWIWRALFNTGLEYVALVFFSDFLVFPLAHGTAFSLSYFPFTVLLLTATCMRWTAGVYGLFRENVRASNVPSSRLAQRLPGRSL